MLQDTHSCDLFSGDVQLLKELRDGYFYQVDSSIFSITRSRCTVIDDEQFLAIYMFTINTNSFQPFMTGSYEALVLNLNVSTNFAIDFSDFCQVSYYHGLVWSTLGPGQIEVQLCSSLGANFANVGNISLSCLNTTQNNISLVSECYLLHKSNVIKILLLSHYEVNSRILDPVINTLSAELNIDISQFSYENIQHPTLKTEFTHLHINISNGDINYLNYIRMRIWNIFMTSPQFSYFLLDVSIFTPSETCHCQFEITETYPYYGYIYEACPYR